MSFSCRLTPSARIEHYNFELVVRECRVVFADDMTVRVCVVSIDTTVMFVCAALCIFDIIYH